MCCNTAIIESHRGGSEATILYATARAACPTRYAASAEQAVVLRLDDPVTLTRGGHTRARGGRLARCRMASAGSPQTTVVRPRTLSRVRKCFICSPSEPLGAATDVACRHAGRTHAPPPSMLGLYFLPPSMDHRRGARPTFRLAR
jgi:hypothetical protein